MKSAFGFFLAAIVSYQNAKAQNTSITKVDGSIAITADLSFSIRMIMF